MLPSKLTIGELNEINKPLGAKETARLRWERFMEQKDKLPECRSRADVAALAGFDITNKKARGAGGSWVKNLIEREVLEETNTPGIYGLSSYRILKEPFAITGVQRPRKRVKNPVKAVAPVVEPVKPAAKPAAKPVELVERSITLSVRRGRRKGHTIEATFKGLSGTFVEEQIKELISKLK